MITWDEFLNEQSSRTYFKVLKKKVSREYSSSISLPKAENIFRVFKLTPFDKVRVVILGQDPYPTPGVANGLAFAVNKFVAIPPSLRNIFNEIESEGYPCAKDRTLENWAEQGVFLLNTILTVKNKHPGAHRGLGWQKFTIKVIETLSEHHEHLVFLLWGRIARDYKGYIDSKHLILEGAYPSPRSVNKGFVGCGHFRDVNDWLEAHDEEPIKW